MSTLVRTYLSDGFEEGLPGDLVLANSDHERRGVRGSREQSLDCLDSLQGGLGERKVDQQRIASGRGRSRFGQLTRIRS